MIINKTLRPSSLKTRTAMNAKISVFVICVEAIIFLLSYNLHDRTFKHCLGQKLGMFRNKTEQTSAQLLKIRLFK